MADSRIFLSAVWYFLYVLCLGFLYVCCLWMFFWQNKTPLLNAKLQQFMSTSAGMFC